MNTSTTRCRTLGTALLVGVLLPTPALAHVKWFEDAAQHPVRLDLIVSDRTLLWLATSATALATLCVLQRVVGRRDWPHVTFFGKMAVGAPTILAIQAAIGLVSSAAQPSLLAPNLSLGFTGAGVAVGLVELLIALSFITGAADWLGAIALIALVPLAALLFSPAEALEQLFWVGIGVAILVIGRGSHDGGRARPWFQRHNPDWQRRAITVLRIATGVSLIAVALSEKIWNPELGGAFLRHRPFFNIVQTALGVPWFTDDLFALAAGLTEAAIGAMLISGMLPRLVILAMWLPFHLGIPVLPPQELLGHLPIFGTMYLVFVHGAASPTARAGLQPLVAPTRASESSRRPAPAVALAERATLSLRPVAGSPAPRSVRQPQADRRRRRGVRPLGARHARQTAQFPEQGGSD